MDGAKVEQEYKELVDLVAERDLDLDFPNSSVEHAKYVISKMIEKTKKEIFIYSQTLKNEIFDNGQIITALQKNQTIKKRILLENNDKEGITKYKVIPTVEIKLLKQAIDNSFYFVVSDNQRIRMCLKDKPHQARVNFNKKFVGERLSNTFENHWVKASPL